MKKPAKERQPHPPPLQHQKDRVAYFNNGEINKKGFWNIETSFDAMFVDLSKKVLKQDASQIKRMYFSEM